MADGDVFRRTLAAASPRRHKAGAPRIPARQPEGLVHRDGARAQTIAVSAAQRIEARNRIGPEDPAAFRDLRRRRRSPGRISRRQRRPRESGRKKKGR
ncbi:hypothetical protein [Cupriavidus basilensis]|uniref:hypothetical protein n=1 Tax=Cupriavidus basilensis TaxID=68895 RepID=UPI000B29CAE9|nr:hypothetical protein [Cupriavidus basilensis]